MKMPEDMETMRSFVGMANFLSKYSAWTAHLRALLSALTYQHKDYKITDEHLKCLNELKMEISNIMSMQKQPTDGYFQERLEGGSDATRVSH